MLQCTPHHERIGEGNSHHAISRIGRRHGAGVGECERTVERDASWGGVTNRAFLLLCSSCLTVTILQLYGKLIAQYMNLLKIGCSKAFLDSPFDIWLKAPTRRATRWRTKRSTCLSQILRHNMRITGALSSAPLLLKPQKHLTDYVALPSRNQLNFFTNARTDPSNQIFVFFSDEKSVGVKTMRKLVDL